MISLRSLIVLVVAALGVIIAASCLLHCSSAELSVAPILTSDSGQGLDAPELLEVGLDAGVDVGPELIEVAVDTATMLEATAPIDAGAVVDTAPGPDVRDAGPSYPTIAAATCARTARCQPGTFARDWPGGASQCAVAADGWIAGLADAGGHCDSAQRARCIEDTAGMACGGSDALFGLAASCAGC